MEALVIKTHHVELFLAEKAVLVLVKLSERQLDLVQLLAALQQKRCREKMSIPNNRMWLGLS